MADNLDNACDDDSHACSGRSSRNFAPHVDCKTSWDGSDDDGNDPAEIIKSKLFKYIASSKTLPHLVAARDFDGASQNIILACHDEIIRIGLAHDLGHDKILGILATVILHYGLTKALVKSQRQITYGKTHLDIVIPDVKTLARDPLRTLIVCVAATDQTDVIGNWTNSGKVGILTICGRLLIRSVYNQSVIVQN